MAISPWRRPSAVLNVHALHVHFHPGYPGSRPSRRPRGGRLWVWSLPVLVFLIALSQNWIATLTMPLFVNLVGPIPGLLIGLAKVLAHLIATATLHRSEPPSGVEIHGVNLPRTGLALPGGLPYS